MTRKLKFRPEITRVKLNPEQAVLSCNCYDSDHMAQIGTGENQGWDASGVDCSWLGKGAKGGITRSHGDSIGLVDDVGSS